MCIYTKAVENPRFKKWRKENGGLHPNYDYKKAYVPIECGECIECRRKKAREWKTRIREEWKDKGVAHFVTLTFSEKELDKLEVDAKSKTANTVAALAIKRFYDRWRKEKGEKLRYWLITELGHEGTERLHLHGLIFQETNNDEIKRIWKYGVTQIGYSMNEKVISYIAKYVTKPDKDHEGFKGKIFPSKGIGEAYVNKWTKYYHRFRGDKTIQYMKDTNGNKVAMPMYYRKKFWTERERDILWSLSIEKDKMYILGQEVNNVSTKEGAVNASQAIKDARRISRRMGYKGDEVEKREYFTRNGVEKFG